MSCLSVPSPVLAKRHFDEGEAGEGFERQFGGKRSRLHHSPAAARRFAAAGLHALPPATASALLALFPGMDERTVAGVLLECGNNIDAAIRRLGELRLTGAAAAEDGAPAGASSHPGAAAAAAAAVEREQAEPAAAAEAGAQGGAQPDAPGGPVTAEQWVEALVAQMAAASDMADARQRAADFLRTFEAFVARFVRQQQQQQQGASGPPGTPGAGTPPPSHHHHARGGGAAAAAGTPHAGGTPLAAAAAAPSPLPDTPAGLAARAAKLAEENAVLKKAVQIQHRQLQERAGAEGEAAQLRAMLAQYQEQVRTLQVANYSLSLHLQKATSSDFSHTPRNPDVF